MSVERVPHLVELPSGITTLDHLQPARQLRTKHPLDGRDVAGCHSEQDRTIAVTNPLVADDRPGGAEFVETIVLGLRGGVPTSGRRRRVEQRVATDGRPTLGTAR
jgi:hypothetical protein